MYGSAGQFITESVLSELMNGLKGLIQTVFKVVFIVFENLFGVLWQPIPNGFILSLGSKSIELKINATLYLIQFIKIFLFSF